MIEAATGAIADHVQSLGLGILGMRQRLRQFGGQLAIHTSHHGTEIIATVPLTSAPTGQRARGSVREMMMVNILLADDHAIMRRGLRGLLETHEDWQVCGEAGDGRQAVEWSVTTEAGDRGARCLHAGVTWARSRQANSCCRT